MLVPAPNFKVVYRRGDIPFLSCSSNGSLHGWEDTILPSTLIGIAISKQPQTFNKHQSMGQALRESTQVLSVHHGAENNGVKQFKTTI